MRVAHYARVSTDDHEQNPERQLLKCRQYSELHGHEVIGEWAESEHGETPPDERAEFPKLLAARPDGIVLFSIDRFSREHPAKVMSRLGQFKDQGIKIISISEPIFNMESEFADLMMYFLAWWNNYFLKKLRRDIKTGMERAKEKGTRSGKPIGRPEAKFNQFRAYQLLSDGKSQRQIAAELGVGVATINRFKRFAAQNPGLFINEDSVPITNGFGAEDGSGKSM